MPNKRKKSLKKNNRRNARKTNSVDPKTVEDAKSEIMRYFAQRELEHPFTQRLEALGFASVECAYNVGRDLWEFRATRGANQDCRTAKQVEAMVARLAREVSHEIASGLIVAIVQGDQIVARFRLRPIAQPV